MPGFSHAGDDDASLAIQDQSTGSGKLLIDTLTERENGGRFIFDDSPCRRAEQVGSRMVRFTLSGGRHGVLYSHADIMPFLRA
jgi:hypothetical protein